MALPNGDALTLPSSQGSADQLLMNTASAGTLEFADLAVGDMPTGSILQVKQAVKTDTFSTGTSGFNDVTGLSVDITPSSNTTKILVMCAVNYAQNGGNRTAARIVRRESSTDNVISQGDAAGSRTRAMWIGRHALVNGAANICPIQFLDSPTTTNPLTYKFQVGVIDSGTMQINFGYSDTDSSSHGRPISTITVMEVAA